MEHVAIYPGSFDPVTNGHLDVIGRGRRLFDRLVVGVGQNPSKPALFTPDERIEMIASLMAEEKGPGDSAPVDITGFRGLTVDFARDAGATAILKGVRNLSDLQYEVQQAVTNREVAGLETVFIVAGQTFAYTSSSLIKQIAALGDDLSVLLPMVPPLVVARLQAKKRSGHPVLERLRASGGDED